jgi:hypothetical protein
MSQGARAISADSFISPPDGAIVLKMRFQGCITDVTMRFSGVFACGSARRLFSFRLCRWGSRANARLPPLITGWDGIVSAAHQESLRKLDQVRNASFVLANFDPYLRRGEF